MEKILFKNENISLKDLSYGDYRINTYNSEGTYNGDVILSKEDIEKIYFTMKLNEIK